MRPSRLHRSKGGFKKSPMPGSFTCTRTKRVLRICNSSNGRSTRRSEARSISFQHSKTPEGQRNNFPQIATTRNKLKQVAETCRKLLQIATTRNKLPQIAVYARARAESNPIQIQSNPNPNPKKNPIQNARAGGNMKRMICSNLSGAPTRRKPETSGRRIANTCMPCKVERLRTRSSRQPSNCVRRWIRRKSNI